MQRLATLLGVSVDWLATGRDADGSRTADPTPAYDGALTSDEREILDRYARLDDAGQQALLAVLRRLRPARR